MTNYSKYVHAGQTVFPELDEKPYLPAANIGLTFRPFGIQVTLWLPKRFIWLRLGKDI